VRGTKRLNPFFRLHEASELNSFSRVADLTFLNTVGFFGNKKKPEKIWIFQSERLDSGKTLSELHIHYKYLLKRVYNHAGCTKYLREKKILLKSGTVLYRCF